MPSITYIPYPALLDNSFKVTSCTGLTVLYSFSLFVYTTSERIADRGIISCVLLSLYYTGSYLEAEFGAGRNWRLSIMSFRSSRWGSCMLNDPMWRQVKGQTCTIVVSVFLWLPAKAAVNNGTKSSLGISSRPWIATCSLLNRHCIVSSNSVGGSLVSILMNLHFSEKHLENLTDIHSIFFAIIVSNIDNYL